MAFAMFSMLNTAKDNGIRSLAMPAIGTGVFKFPPMLAARITAKALREFEKKTNAIDLMRICVVSEDLRQQYESAIDLEGEAC
jgi:O-acetyl-ADP-ribose deacetylase (regulator of RNase III)